MHSKVDLNHLWQELTSLQKIVCSAAVDEDFIEFTRGHSAHDNACVVQVPLLLLFRGVSKVACEWRGAATNAISPSTYQK